MLLAQGVENRSLPSVRYASSAISYVNLKPYTSVSCIGGKGKVARRDFVPGTTEQGCCAIFTLLAVLYFGAWLRAVETRMARELVSTGQSSGA